MEWTQVMWLVTVAAAAYYIGFARGIFYAIRRARELMEELDIEEEEQEQAKPVVPCRAELIGDVMYLYQQKEGSERFLAQGTDLEQLVDHVKARVGEAKVEVALFSGEAERAWFKQFGKGT